MSLMKLDQRLPQRVKEPVWSGPENDGPQGGITQSMLAKFLTCRERFRLYVVKGLKDAHRFNHRLEYGNLFHLAEETHVGGGDWLQAVTAYAQDDLCRQWPMDREQIDKWFNACVVQFPEYVRFWANRPDVQGRTPLLQEEVFHVPYQLPSGRTVWLRGKWDDVSCIQAHIAEGMRYPAGIWITDHKTKGEVDKEQITRQLSWDLQTMFYVVAFLEWQKQDDYGEPIRTPELVEQPLLGIRYNVIRRPLSGGKGTIRQHEATKGSKCPKCKDVRLVGAPLCFKCNGVGRIGGKPAESNDAYWERVRLYIAEEPHEFFFRWTCPLSSADVERFKRETLNPTLEHLCWWHDFHVKGVTKDLSKVGYLMEALHYRMPFGINSPLLDGGETDMDFLLVTGSETGLQRTMNLFPELQP